MGANFSRAAGCFAPSSFPYRHRRPPSDILPAASPSDPDPLLYSDHGLGHSFCYIRPSPDPSDPPPPSAAALPLGLPPSSHLDANPLPPCRQVSWSSGGAAAAAQAETSFKTISGASVSANTLTPRSVAHSAASCYAHPHATTNAFCDAQAAGAALFDDTRAAAFEGSASFNSLPLQPVPRGGAPAAADFSSMYYSSGPIMSCGSGSSTGVFSSSDRGFLSGPMERGVAGLGGAGFLSGPIERGFLSGPMERGSISGPNSAELVGATPTQASSAAARPSRLMQFVRKLTFPAAAARSGHGPRFDSSAPPSFRDDGDDENAYDEDGGGDASSSCPSLTENPNLQWAHGRAGEDRLHVILSEDHGWLFVGIYDGFNGPDAPDFLVSHLYRHVYKQLRGLLWDRPEDEIDGAGAAACSDATTDTSYDHERIDPGGRRRQLRREDASNASSREIFHHRKRDDGSRSPAAAAATAGLNHDDGNKCPQKDIDVQDRRSRFLDGLRRRINRAAHRRDGAREGQSDLRQRRRQKNGTESSGTRTERNLLARLKRSSKKAATVTECRMLRSSSGTADHAAVLAALQSALESTELLFMEMAEQSIEEMPELALMGSCVLVMLMKGADVYVMNVGDSRAILARAKDGECRSGGDTRMASAEAELQSSYSPEKIGARDWQLRQELERIMEEAPCTAGGAVAEAAEGGAAAGPPPARSPELVALQLSSDHSTNVEEEVERIRAEHPDDGECVVKERVKGRLKVTRAFGAGFLKAARWNEAVLEVFRVEYVGAAPYVTCMPALQHHVLGPDDRFIVLSSDGLYQYLSNDEVVAGVEWFMEAFPDGDPAQYLIEQLLFRAARNAGMDFHELLEIPHGDRRKYHDDVCVMVISLEGRIWRSFG